MSSPTRQRDAENCGPKNHSGNQCGWTPISLERKCNRAQESPAEMCLSDVAVI
jgi:hypothetical protein